MLNLGDPVFLPCGDWGELVAGYDSFDKVCDAPVVDVPDSCPQCSLSGLCEEHRKSPWLVVKLKFVADVDDSYSHTGHDHSRTGYEARQDRLLGKCVAVAESEVK